MIGYEKEIPATAYVKVFQDRFVFERSWRTLWRERLVLRPQVIFAGRIHGGSIRRTMNGPGVAHLTVYDAMADLMSDRRMVEQ